MFYKHGISVEKESYLGASKESLPERWAEGVTNTRSPKSCETLQLTELSGQLAITFRCLKPLKYIQHLFKGQMQIYCQTVRLVTREKSGITFIAVTTRQ